MARETLWAFDPDELLYDEDDLWDSPDDEEDEEDEEDVDELWDDLDDEEDLEEDLDEGDPENNLWSNPGQDLAD